MHAANCRTQLDPSGASIPTDRHFAAFDDHGHRSSTLAEFQHLIKTPRFRLHIDVANSISLGEVLTGLRCIGSGILPENENVIRHDMHSLNGNSTASAMGSKETR